MPSLASSQSPSTSMFTTTQNSSASGSYTLRRTEKCLDLPTFFARQSRSTASSQQQPSTSNIGVRGVPTFSSEPLSYYESYNDEEEEDEEEDAGFSFMASTSKKSTPTQTMRRQSTTSRVLQNATILLSQSSSSSSSLSRPHQLHYHRRESLQSQISSLSISSSTSYDCSSDTETEADDNEVESAWTSFASTPLLSPSSSMYSSPDKKSSLLTPSPLTKVERAGKGKRIFYLTDEPIAITEEDEREMGRVSWASVEKARRGALFAGLEDEDDEYVQRCMEFKSATEPFLARSSPVRGVKVEECEGPLAIVSSLESRVEVVGKEFFPSILENSLASSTSSASSSYSPSSESSSESLELNAYFFSYSPSSSYTSAFTPLSCSSTSSSPKPSSSLPFSDSTIVYTPTPALNPRTLFSYPASSLFPRSSSRARKASRYFPTPSLNNHHHSSSLSRSNSILSLGLGGGVGGDPFGSGGDSYLPGPGDSFFDDDDDDFCAVSISDSEDGDAFDDEDDEFNPDVDIDEWKRLLERVEERTRLETAMGMEVRNQPYGRCSLDPNWQRMYAMERHALIVASRARVARFQAQSRLSHSPCSSSSSKAKASVFDNFMPFSLRSDRRDRVMLQKSQVSGLVGRRSLDLVRSLEGARVMRVGSSLREVACTSSD